MTRSVICNLQNIERVAQKRIARLDTRAKKQGQKRGQERRKKAFAFTESKKKEKAKKKINVAVQNGMDAMKSTLTDCICRFIFQVTVKPHI